MTLAKSQEPDADTMNTLAKEPNSNHQSLMSPRSPDDDTTSEQGSHDHSTVEAHEPKRRHVVIHYPKLDARPPIFVSTNITTPPWTPLEMAYDTDRAASEDGSACFKFFREFKNVVEGDYQYKFRLGSGDWWTTDETVETVTDDMGNKNNVLHVVVNSVPPVTGEVGNLNDPKTSLPQKGLRDVLKSSTVRSSSSEQQKHGTIAGEQPVEHEEVKPGLTPTIQPSGSEVTSVQKLSDLTGAVQLDDQKPEIHANAQAGHKDGSLLRKGSVSSISTTKADAPVSILKEEQAGTGEEAPLVEELKSISTPSKVAAQVADTAAKMDASPQSTTPKVLLTGEGAELNGSSESLSKMNTSATEISGSGSPNRDNHSRGGSETHDANIVPQNSPILSEVASENAQHAKDAIAATEAMREQHLASLPGDVDEPGELCLEDPYSAEAIQTREESANEDRRDLKQAWAYMVLFFSTMWTTVQGFVIKFVDGYFKNKRESPAKDADKDKKE